MSSSHTSLTQPRKSSLIIDFAYSEVPYLSIMIPTYKRPHYLSKTILSAVNQDCSFSTEIVVVNNDPEIQDVDPVLDIVCEFSSYPVRYFRNACNLGLYGNWNRCIELARADYLTILNDDDLLKPSFASTVIKTMTQFPEIAACGSYVDLIDQNDFPISLPFLSAVRNKARDLLHAIKHTRLHYIGIEDLLLSYPFCGSLSLLFKKSLFASIGGYQTNLHPVSDYALAVKIVKSHRLAIVHQSLACYRIAVNSLSTQSASLASIQSESSLRLSLALQFPRFRALISFYDHLRTLRSSLIHDHLWRPRQAPILKILINLIITFLLVVVTVLLRFLFAICSWVSKKNSPKYAFQNS